MRKKLTHELANVRAILPQVAEREVQQLTGNWPNDSPSLQTKSLSILWTDVVVKRPYRAMKWSPEDRIAVGRVFVAMPFK